jgi:hypothetical protein
VSLKRVVRARRQRLVNFGEERMEPQVTMPATAVNPKAELIDSALGEYALQGLGN